MICRQCGQVHRSTTRTCPDCLARLAAIRADRRASGLCNYRACSSLAVPNRRYCVECLAYFAEHSRRQRQRKKLQRPPALLKEVLSDFDAIL